MRRSVVTQATPEVANREIPPAAFAQQRGVGAQQLSASLLVSLMVLMSCPRAGHGIVILDQVNDKNLNFAANLGRLTDQYQQVITSGVDGRLSSVDIYVTDPGYSALFSIYDGASWQSGAANFQTIVTPQANGWLNIDASSANLAISAGTQFTIGLQGISPQPWYGYGGPGFVGTADATTDRYSGGGLFLNGSPFDFNGLYPYTDMAFRTYVDAAAPDVDVGSVLGDSVSVRTEGGAITASFRPNGYSLQDAATLLDVDHFNWVNIVTEDWDLALMTFARDLGLPLPQIANLQDLNGNLPSVPYFDPVAGGFGYQRSPEMGYPEFRADDLPWYYDEKYTFSEGWLAPGPLGNLQTAIEYWYDISGGSAADGVPSTSTLDFRDEPGSPMRVEFLTALAGVYPDGTGVILDYPGTTFRWEFIGAFWQTDYRFTEFSELTPDELALFVDVPVLRQRGGAGGTGSVNMVPFGGFTEAERALLSRSGIAVVGAAPEPTTIALLTLGLAGLAWSYPRRH